MFEIVFVQNERGKYFVHYINNPYNNFYRPEKIQMNNKYLNKYRIASSRLKNWDYGWNGACFVTICTIHARKINTDFAWQSRFNDHVIRDEMSFNGIVIYILENPINWKGDRNYT